MQNIIHYIMKNSICYNLCNIISYKFIIKRYKMYNIMQLLYY